jgi:Flp pilus assembly protein TadD
LTHFILSDPARRQQMNAFLIDYRQGADPVEAFEKAFGIKVKDLASLLDRYMRSFPAAIYQFKDMPSPDITVTTLPASANKLLLWDAADRLCPLQGEMAPLLEKIRTEAALYPGDDFAARVLAQAEIILGDEWKAVDYLQGRIAAVPDDAQAHFMLGQAWYLMTVHKHLLDGETADSQMDKARRELGRAYTLDPLDAPTLYYYARSLARAGQPPSDNMIAAAMEAQALEPNVSNYSAYAAFLLIQRDRFDEAKEMLTSLASNPHAPREAAWAKSVIAAIDRHASPQEISKAFSSPTPADTPAEAPAK